MIFGKICYAACMINRTGQLICLHAGLHKHNVSLTNLHLKARFIKTIIAFIKGSVANNGWWSVITSHFIVFTSQPVSVISVLSSENYNSS